jgi:DNA-binding CsgD family transcriptional regulator
LRAVRRNGAHAARIALIERDEAWKLASRAIGVARAGAGSVVLFEGPSGMGKTGLMAAIRALVRESGVQLLSAAGHRRETNLSFGVVLQLFEPHARRFDRPEPFVPRQPAGIGCFSSLTAIHDLYRGCATLAKTAPLVVGIDDADLADDQSLHFLLYLTERLPELPIAVFLTAGTVAPRRAPALLAEIARHRCTTRSRLKPLSSLGTARRVAKTTFSASAQEAAQEIHNASGGNPFIVDSLARALAEAEEGGGEAPATTVRGLASPGIAEWALVRAAELAPGAPALLNAVAVLGPDCELRHACALANVEPEATGEIVDALTEVELLAPSERLSFAQPAVAVEIERAQTPRERGAFNLRAARMLADAGASPERVADHLLHSTRIGSAATVDTLSVAAAVSLGRAKPRTAVQYLRRALEEPPPRERRAQVVLDLGRAEAMAGEPQAASHLTDGLAQLVDGPEHPRAALDTGRTLFALGRYTEAVPALERGLKAKRDTDAETASTLAIAHATAMWLASLSRGRSFELAPPPASADTAGDRALLALHAIDGALRAERSWRVRDLAERALAGGRLLKDETSDGLTYYLAAAALTLAGDLQGAEGALTHAVHDAQSRGSLLGFANALHARAMAILRRGRVRDAALDARKALAMERDGWRSGVCDARVVLAHTLMERGDLQGARRHLDAADTTTSGTDPFRLFLLSARGRLALHSGDADSALDFFMACGELAERAAIVNPALVPWRADAGLATAVLGDSSEAEQLIETELGLADDFGEPAAIGRALRALGSVRPPERALETFEAAVAKLQDSQAALDQAGAFVDFGAALRRSGRRRAAREPLRAGLELAERCGATVLAARARGEAKAAGARPRRTALRGREALTAREHQVAALASAGLSNRRIAEQLVVTVKTVEWHLKNSYLKLGVASRKELHRALGEVEPELSAGGRQTGIQLAERELERSSAAMMNGGMEPSVLTESVSDFSAR